MEIGDIVQVKDSSRYVLRCGSGSYCEAVVVSVDPFILVSIEADMRWKATIRKEDFEVIGQATDEILSNCNDRLIS